MNKSRIAVACLAAVTGLAGTGQARPAALNLRGFQVERDGDTWSGRFSYALVVGTFFEWNTDPTAIPGLFSELRRRTRIRSRVDFNTVSLSSPQLFANPFLMLTGDRYFRLSPAEIENLRAYLLAGGALYADDCGGADHAFRHMLGQLFPDQELVVIPPDHQIFSIHYRIAEVPKILDLYGTSARAFGIFIDGRLAVVYTYDTDIPCGWEKNPDGSFVHMLAPEKHEVSIRLGINVVLYFLSRVAGLDMPAPEDVAEVGP